MSFESKFARVGTADLPAFSSIRVMMLPVVIGDASSLPHFIAQYKPLFQQLAVVYPRHLGSVGYLTIDEKTVQPATTHRRAGLHVDGVYKGRAGGWGGGGGGWGSVGAGMLTVASHVGCRAWQQTFEGWPGMEGECDHLAAQCQQATTFEAGSVYWVDGLCVHESLSQTETVARQFVRLSMPSDAPWFEGYTVNPLGVLPTGEILPKREFMNQ